MAWIHGQSRSSTATERLDTSGNVGSMPIGRANFDGPLSLGYRKRETASGCKSRAIRQLMNSHLALCPSFHFIGPNVVRLSNSMAEHRPCKPEVAGSTPASDAISCPIAFGGRAPALFDGSQDWVIVDNDAVAGSSPVSGSRCRGSSVVEHVNSQFVSYPSVFIAGRRLWVLVDPAVAV